MDYSKLNIGEPAPHAAFPVPKHADGSGISKREHFALEILVAILANEGAHDCDGDDDARRAVMYADSLIARLDRKAEDAAEAPVD